MTVPSKNGSWRHRQHTYKRRGSESGNRRLWGSHRCGQCGKWSYKSRDDAEAAVRIMHPGATVHYYRCDGFWHYTSMSAEQVEGLKQRKFDEDGDGAPEELAV